MSTIIFLTEINQVCIIVIMSTYTARKRNLNQYGIIVYEAGSQSITDFIHADTGEKRLIRHLIKSGITECIRLSKQYYNAKSLSLKRRLQQEIIYNKDFLSFITPTLCIACGFTDAVRILQYINIIQGSNIKQLSGLKNE